MDSSVRQLHSATGLLRCMLLIRHFETRVDQLFAAGELRGTSHLSAGQEAVAAGACAALQPDDYVSSNHRGHGHFLAKGADAHRLMAELFGKEPGYSQGRGGTQHVADLGIGFLGMNGITAGMLPVATGAAFSAKYRGSGQIALAFFGDGASNQGAFHEALNMAAIWQLPAVYLCENNCYAMSSPACGMVSVCNIADRAAGYGIPGVIVDGNDVLAVRDAVAAATDRARAGGGPTLIEAKTYRLFGHSRGDLCVYRTREEEAAWAANDPITRFRDRLLADGALTADAYAALEQESCAEVDDAVAFARSAPVWDGLQPG
ncbi:MAG: thiamine pyrophosphate-dependent dehydrogenase E1 component subunit alpha [Armatimonadota bacterium]